MANVSRTTRSRRRAVRNRTRASEDSTEDAVAARMMGRPQDIFPHLSEQVAQYRYALHHPRAVFDQQIKIPALPLKASKSVHPFVSSIVVKPNASGYLAIAVSLDNCMTGDGKGILVWNQNAATLDNSQYLGLHTDTQPPSRVGASTVMSVGGTPYIESQFYPSDARPMCMRPIGGAIYLDAYIGTERMRGGEVRALSSTIYQPYVTCAAIGQVTPPSTLSWDAMALNPATKYFYPGQEDFSGDSQLVSSFPASMDAYNRWRYFKGVVGGGCHVWEYVDSTVEDSTGQGPLSPGSPASQYTNVIMCKAPTGATMSEVEFKFSVYTVYEVAGANLTDVSMGYSDPVGAHKAVEHSLINDHPPMLKGQTGDLALVPPKPKRSLLQEFGRHLVKTTSWVGPKIVNGLKQTLISRPSRILLRDASHYLTGMARAATGVAPLLLAASPQPSDSPATSDSGSPPDATTVSLYAQVVARAVRDGMPLSVAQEKFAFLKQQIGKYPISPYEKLKTEKQ